jgi:hypothetical protein
VEEVYAFYDGLLKEGGLSGEEIQDIFVTDYVDAEGRRNYESLWLFTPSYVMEAKQFLSENNFDFTLLKDCVRLWRIKKRDYDFRKAEPESRMYLELSLAQGAACVLKASQENCDYLRDIFLKYILPNVVRNS